MDKEQTRFKEWKLPHPLILHWVLNPGLAFNELVLGQRLPKLTLIDQESDEPLVHRQYVPCPHCDALNDGMLWSGSNGFGHWFGLVCPECQGRIPCLWNLTSLAILGLTFPIWIWIKIFGEDAWLEREKIRATKAVDKKVISQAQPNWLRTGLVFGGLMFVIMSAVEAAQGDLTIELLALNALIWGVAGLAFGFIMKLFLGRKPTR